MAGGCALRVHCVQRPLLSHLPVFAPLLLTSHSGHFEENACPSRVSTAAAPVPGPKPVRQHTLTHSAAYAPFSGMHRVDSRFTNHYASFSHSPFAHHHLALAHGTRHTKRAPNINTRTSKYPSSLITSDRGVISYLYSMWVPWHPQCEIGHPQRSPGTHNEMYLILDVMLSDSAQGPSHF